VSGAGTIASPVVIMGARSDIGRALARGYAARGARVVLAGRGDLAADVQDLALRSNGTKVQAMAFDVTDDNADAFFAALGEPPGTVVMVAGLLGDQARSAASDIEAALVMATNYNGPARYLLAAARVMAGVPGGCIIGISSVAGDRGRASNFVYGSAKAGFTAFLSGLRNAHARAGLHVMTVKPGFVATQMTKDMKLNPALTAQPDEVAAAIIKAHLAGRNVLYVRSIWRLIMTIIGAIPEALFKKLSL
jgi:NAD(P)-dependent dehydrogenase (short-subunit alcohol dehydrogenase family)